MAYKAISLIMLITFTLALSTVADEYSYSSSVKDKYTPAPKHEVYSSPNHHYDHTYQIDTTVVMGYVYCQGCYGQWTKHLAGAKVAAECKNNKGVVVAKGNDTTDEYGFYEIKLPYNYRSRYGMDKCTAKIVESSDYTCNVPTNVGKGKDGAKVDYLKSYYSEAFFKVAPFAFSQVCQPHY